MSTLVSVGLPVLVVLGILAVIIPLVVTNARRGLVRFHHETAALGFARSPAPGAAGRNHAVGDYQGVPTIIGYYPGDGNPLSDVTRTGVAIWMNVAATGPSLEPSDASRIAEGSLVDVVIDHTWTRGWTGPVTRRWLPLSADRHAIREGLDAILAGR